MIKEIYYKIEPKFSKIKIFKKLYDKRPWRKFSRRYRYLFEAIRANKSKKIMEIGAWSGGHSLQMIEEAKKYSRPKKIQYYGFDVFEALDSETSLREFAKVPPNIETVRQKLEKTGVEIHLYKGYTRDVLPKVINTLPKMDFVFIDGGHSVETIKNDWKYVQKIMNEKTIVLFDDYWNRTDAGCKKIIDNIDKTKYEVKILPIQDKFQKEWGVLKVNFAQVRKLIN